VRRGKGNVLVRVSLRVNDGGTAGCLVGDQVRGVGQARQIELLEDYCTPASLAGCRFG
jgi:hypothetical protein